ncbi:MAG: amino acid ABC transporter substrate-binding protein [Anaerolineales bacterium]|nr:amino acid ABC transporter substrate-binding protein [Anaerolineales bacterium]
MNRKLFTLIVVLISLSLILASCGTTECPECVCPEAGECPEVAVGGERFQLIKDRGYILCGVNAELVGFGYLNPEGEFEGFDVDFCKAYAAAVFGDPTAVEYRPLVAAERLPALQTGEIDVLIRNTTWTLTRDTANELDWAVVTFYDGQGMMVRADSGFKTLEDMAGATVCTTTGTTTEMNLADSFRMRGVEYTPLLFESTQDTNTAYEEGRCDGETSDKSQLAALRTAMAEPEEHVIIDVTMSKEPLGPLTAHGDNQWNDVVRWVAWGIMEAEESGVNSQNVDEMLNSENPTIKRLLGVEGEMGASLGIPNDFMVHVLKAVGNYKEIYMRHLGPFGIDIPRGPNELWTNGGLLYPMAWR